ncbi:MAG TPA: hypothetical protein VM913_07790 [Sphingomicrobium sp.]|nr:hypothetical protein [Sphingomicrobium sp.]
MEQLREHGYSPRHLIVWNSGRADKLRTVGHPMFLAWCLLNPSLVPGRAARQLLGAVGRTRQARRRGGLVLLDEGPVKLHKRISLRSSRAAGLLRRGIPAPDVLVIVTCDPQVRLARLRKTGRVHAQTRTDEELLKDASGADFAQRFAAERKVPVVEIDTSSDDNAAPRLYELLQPFLAGAASPTSTRSFSDFLTPLPSMPR